MTRVSSAFPLYLLYYGTVGIMEKLGATYKYKENCYERKVRGVLKSWGNKKLIARLSFMLRSTVLKIMLWTVRTHRSCLFLNIP